MTFNKIKYYIVLAAIILSWANFAYANIIINEVELSPTESRFIELYNSGSSPVDLTNWYIQRKTANGTFGSLVSKTNFENKTIDAGSYFVISKSLIPNTDIAVDNLTLTESNTIQIKNSEGNIINKVGWGSTNDCGNSCASNPTSGKSIQRISDGSWIISLPTPGASNSESQNDSRLDDSSNNTSNNSEGEANSTVSETPLILKITTKIISPKTVTAGIPFSIYPQTTSNKGNIYAVGKFVWNFGDGKVSEASKSSPFDYTYEYPGEYVMTLSYFESSLRKVPDAIDRITVKVVPSEIFISSVGSSSDPYVELENKSKDELILSNWVVTAGMHYFIIPTGTTLLPGKKIKLSPKITGFVGSDMISVSIANPNNEITADYSAGQTKRVTQRNTMVNAIPTVQVDNNTQNPILKDSQVINLNDLGVEVTGSNGGIPNSSYPLIGLLVVIGLGISSFLLIKMRNKNNVYDDGMIRAEDMTIIE